MANEVHTVPDKKYGWANEENGKVISRHRTKAVATREGRKLAVGEEAEHFIHKKDGTIGQKNSYGNDPRKIPG